MMDVEAIIAEANAEPVKTETVAAPEQEAKAASTEVTQEIEPAKPEETDDSQESDDISKKPDSELTPEQLAKREANRQSHLNRKLAKIRLRNENAELKAKLAELQQNTKPQVKDDSPPKLEDYDSLDQWVLATAAHLNNSVSKAAESKQSIAPEDLQRNEAVGKLAKFASETPDYAALEQKNIDILQSAPLEVQKIFFQAENPQLALYALMKEDALEDAYDVPIDKLAYYIGKAEERGKAYLSPVKKVTSATPPIESLRGTGRASKSFEDMSVDELMKQFKQK